ncbi:MAG: arylformamidase [Pseudonocardiales bacterium]|nr:arylformamidase [Pseudonocardiales bacterium]
MKPAHRQYDQSGLDRQFDIAAAVPRFDEHIAWFAAQSRLLRAASPRAALDVPYGVSAAETLDVFPADTPDPQPVQIFFHGGYWRQFSKDDFSFVAGTVNAAGGMAVVVDYALVPSVSLGTLVRQCLDAVAWVAQNIERYGGDPERIFVSGHSAGGHLAAVASTHDWSTHGLARDLVRGVVAISGLYDLEPVRSSNLNEVLRLTDADVDELSPARRPSGRAPVVLAYGAEETDEFRRQAADFRRVRGEAGSTTALIELGGVDHMTAVIELGTSGSQIAQIMLEQMQLPPGAV